MKLLNTLMLFIFCLYILPIGFYHMITKEDFKRSKEAIDSIFLMFGKLLKRSLPKKEQIQYIPDVVLIQKLMTCLAPYSELPMAYTEWLQCTYSSFSLPAIKIQLICKTEENFPIIRNILINVFNQHLSENGLSGIYSWITIEKYGENCYCVVLTYAISDIEKENLKRLIRMRKYQAEVIAKKSVQIVVDDELENELKKSENDDEKK